MFFRRRASISCVEVPVAAFIHQLNEEEMQQHNTIDIKHIGAVIDIESGKKEDTLMVEKLKTYRAELEAKKVDITNKVINVEPEVEAYRQKLIADAEAKKSAEIAKLESDINCIDNIIAREESTVAAEVTPVDTITE